MIGHSQTKRKAQKSVKIIANTIHQQQNFNKNDSETRGLSWEFGLYTAYPRGGYFSWNFINEKV